VDDVLNNLGPGTPGELSTRISLAVKVNELLDQQELSQTAAAERLAMPQSKISAIRNYKLHGISLERLMQALIGLNQRVEIVVKPAGTSRNHSIEVVA
jgi:predicted XRE-type DNA-binding protein